MSGPPEQSSAGVDRFTFAMGEHTAEFPRDRQYASNHMWASAVDSNRWRFGLTAYAVRLLQDVYFLDWTVAESQPVAARDSIGSIESKKAESDLFAAISGTMETINDAVLDDPSLINADPYGDGWLFEIAAAENELDVATGRPRPLMSPESYADHLRDAWEVAQRTIKGQVNQ